MNVIMRRILWRLVRGFIASAIAGAVAKLKDDPEWMWLVPVILTAGNEIRKKWKVTWLPI